MKIKVLVIIMLAGLISACDPTRRLTEHQYLVDKVDVTNHKQTGILKEEFEAFYRQKPNRKLFHKFHVFVVWYNLFDNEKIAHRKIARNMKYDKINAERLRKNEAKNLQRKAKNKREKQVKLKDKDTPLLIESVRDIGEPAVVFDSAQSARTCVQLSKFLFSKGFFNNRVTDSIVFFKGTRKAHVLYRLQPGLPYRVSSISTEIQDTAFARMLKEHSTETLLHAGMQYNETILQAERQRITDLAANNGYYFFENAYISYDADTAFANHTLSLKMRVEQYSSGNGDQRDESSVTNHPKYKIKEVYIITEPTIGDVHRLYFKDTVVSSRKKLKFLLNAPLAYKRKIISMNTDLYPGQLYRRDTATQTYKQLLGLGLFRVSIQFFPLPGKAHELECYIVLNPLQKQSLTAETEGTNTSGNLGVDGNILYQNRNLFKGAELLEVKLQAAVIAQKQFNAASDGTNLQSTFNTIQFGPEIRFSVPRAFFPFSLLPFKKNQEPRTYVKTSVNYQTRPQFSRNITNAEYGFTFKSQNKQFKHELVPFEVYMVRARLDKAFEADLKSYNDAFLLNSFQDHVTTLTKYGLSFTSKESTVNGKKTAYYARLNVQSSGNLLRQIYKVTNQTADSLGRYMINGIPFAQFIKTDFDLRIYVPVRNKSRLVYRVAAGIGKPLTNLSVLPYEQSFFSGGPNSVRAWRARTLGPGGYDPSGSQTRFDKIGDMLLEGNIEYRFHVIRSFYGALFADAGNIWRLQPDPSKLNGEFKLNTFADQIAIGGGFGIRWDLTFFVLRLDLAMPLKDPKFAPGNRWKFKDRPYDYTVANFGIGYPF